MADLYRHFLGHISDRWLHSQLSQFPHDMKQHLPAAFILENRFLSSPGALYDTSHKTNAASITFEKIGYSNENKDFWFICQEFGGNVLFEFLKDYSTRPGVTAWTKKHMPRLR